MKAIIPAAGLGTRFLPGTKCTPKEMLPVLDKPVIQYVVEEALDPEEVDDAIIVTSPGKPELLSYFQPDRSLENLLRERGKDAYADAVAHAGGMPVDFRYQYEPRASVTPFALPLTLWRGRTSWFFWATTLCPTATSATRCLPSPRSTVALLLSPLPRALLRKSAAMALSPAIAWALSRASRMPPTTSRCRLAHRRPGREARSRGGSVQPVHRRSLPAEPVGHGPAGRSAGR